MSAATTTWPGNDATAARFYGGNLAGAVAGSVLAGFYLLRVYDMPTATFVAVALNVFVALMGLVIAARTPHTIITDDVSGVAPSSAAGAKVVAIAEPPDDPRARVS